jgi:hypothetical protein
MSDELNLTNEDLEFLQFCGISAGEDRIVIALQDLKLEAIKMIHNDKSIFAALAGAISAEVERVERIGKPGSWCVECGTLETDSPAVRCGCPFPDSFRCSNRKVCGHCAMARERVARHLDAMFAAKSTVRADSTRLRFFDMLREAACERDFEGIFPKELLPPADRLKFELAQADPFGERERFREAVLRAFRKSKFADFRNLAAKLDSQKDDWTLRAAIGLLRSPTRRARPKSTRVPAFAGEEFYR